MKQFLFWNYFTIEQFLIPWNEWGLYLLMTAFFFQICCPITLQERHIPSLKLKKKIEHFCWYRNIFDILGWIKLLSSDDSIFCIQIMISCSTSKHIPGIKLEQIEHFCWYRNISDILGWIKLLSSDDSIFMILSLHKETPPLCVCMYILWVTWELLMRFMPAAVLILFLVFNVWLAHFKLSFRNISGEDLCIVK